MDATTTIFVCTTCRAAGEPALPMEERSGARLYAALRDAGAAEPGVELVPVQCLSACSRACAVGFSAPGKWTYIYGDMPPATAAPIILEAARLYAAVDDGLVPWRLRSDPIKKGVIARLPPHPAPLPKAPA